MRRIFLSWLALAMIVQVAVVPSAVAQSVPASPLTTDSDIRNSLPRMEEVVQYFVSNKQFMGAVLVARGNEILLNKGYGSANLEMGDTQLTFDKVPIAKNLKRGAGCCTGAC